MFPYGSLCLLLFFFKLYVCFHFDVIYSLFHEGLLGINSPGLKENGDFILLEIICKLELRVLNICAVWLDHSAIVSDRRKYTSAFPRILRKSSSLQPMNFWDTILKRNGFNF